MNAEVDQTPAPEAVIAAVGALSFRQWQVWAVLVMASVCAYFSLAVHNVSQDQKRLDNLISEASQLADPSIIRNGSAWLAGVHRFKPEATRVLGPQGRNIEVGLDQVTRRTIAAGTLSASDREALIQQMHWLLTQLRHTREALDIQASRSTHFYYGSVVAFILAISALLLMRRQSMTNNGLFALFSDDVLFANAPVALSLSDGRDRVLRVNQAFEEITGFAGNELIGQSAHPEDDQEHRSTFQKMYESLHATGSWQGEFRLRKKQGGAAGEKVTRIALGNKAAPDGYLTMSMDPLVSDDEQKLMLWQAHHDNLTKLPNLNLLHERLTRALVASSVDSHGAVQRGAVISVDLNNFQMVNDSIGHDKADRVLTDVAYRIALSARETDTVARVGGDIFVVMMEDIDDVAQAERAARQIVDAMAPPYIVDDRELVIPVSIGVAVFPDDGTDKGELLQKSDAARQGAKSRGDNLIAFFEDDMNKQAARRIELEGHLRRAIAEQAFELHYQPIVDISDDTIYGAEALIRWIDDELGFVSPGEFIPIAEDSGLIKEIGTWVVDEVQRQLTVWQAQGLDKIRVSLNVSAKQVDTENDAQALIERLSSIHRESITVELTESALVNDNPGSEIFLRGLRTQGIRVALDDFGTGYSSVGYLRDYEFDVLKIDKSFIDSICEVRDHGLVASIIAMGRILGMRVVAEGVEEEAQLQQLRHIGCDFVQGYYFSKPLPAADFKSLVEDWGSPDSSSQ